MIQANIQPQSTATILGRPKTPLRLLLRAGRGQTKILNIDAAKCSIGSSPESTLQIVAPGLQPVHCLILRGENGTVVRRLSDDTFLNGTTFDDAHLNAGDRLSLGPVELEVLSSGSNSGNRMPAAQTGSLEKLTADFRRAQAQWRQRYEQQELRLQELTRLLDERTQQLDAERAEWEEQQRKGCESRQGLDEEVNALRTQLAEAQAALSGSQAEWTQERERLDGEAAQIKATLESKEAELGNASEELKALQEKLQTARGDIEQVEQLRARCEELTHELESAEQQRIASAREHESLQNELASAQNLLGEKDDHAASINNELAELTARLQVAESKASEVEELRSNCNGLAEALAAAQTGNEECSTKQQEADHRVASVEAELAEKDEQLRVTADEVESLRSQLEAAPDADETEAVRAQCEQLTRELNATREEWSATSAQHEQLVEQHTSLESELETARQQLASVMETNEGLEAQVQQSADMNSAETVSALESRIKALEDERIADQKRIEAYKQDALAWQEQHGTAQTEIAEIRNELEVARQQLEERESRIREQQPPQEPYPIPRESVSSATDPTGTASSSPVAEPEHEQPSTLDPSYAKEETAVNEEEATMAVDLLDRLRAEVNVAQDHCPVSSNPNTSGEPALAASENVEEPDVTDPHADEYVPVSEEQLAFSEPEESAPVDTASILAQFGHSAEYDEEPDTPPMDNRTTTATVAVAADTADSGEDDSIEDYMAQLMRRVGGGSNDTTSLGEVGRVVPEREATEELTQPVEVEKPETVVPLDPSEFVPRAIAPEASSNLKALRAVANSSTRSAIDKHQRRSLDRNAYLCIFLSIFAGLVCLATAVLSKSVFSVPTLISLIALVVSFFAAMKALALNAKVKLAKNAESKQLALSLDTNAIAASAQVATPPEGATQPLAPPITPVQPQSPPPQG